jgi:putative PEP-CTERM system histidine kinase
MNYPDILGWAGAAVAGAIALLVMWQRPRGVAPWAFIGGLLVFAVGSFFFALSANAVSAEELVGFQKCGLITNSFLPVLWLSFSLTYARGNAQEFLRNWRFILLSAAVLPLALAIGFRDQLINFEGQPVEGEPWLLVLGTPGKLLNVLQLLSTVLVLTNLECTFRAATGTMRWRVKFMVLGLEIIFIVQAYVCSQMLLFHNALNLSLQAVNVMALLLGGALILRALFRRRHFEADIYPPHESFYQSFTVIIAGIYFVVVGLFAKLAEFLGGSTAFEVKAFVLLVALVLLTLLALSDQARLVVRRFASRHFQKPLYDYRSLWRIFSEGTAACVRQEDLCPVGVKLISDTFQVLSVSLWLVNERRENLEFAASTFLSKSRAETIKLSNAEFAELQPALAAHPNPIDLDASDKSWAAVLRRCHPVEFRKGGNRVCVPLMGRGELLGVIIAGDRVSGTPFSWQDFDLLKCVADSLAAGLLNLQLSRKLLQTREIEAFQAVSTFFVHDLKNMTSTLNLMFKNLPDHFDDPEFRRDALRGIGKTVAHINHLIERLGQLRGGLHLNPVASDFNEVLHRALDGWEGVPGMSLENEFSPLPEVPLDREQIFKVITNLMFNAREAVAGKDHGRVRVETSANNGFVVLAVSDNGCGMSQDFLNNSLFRPFQTTKKQGLGIGLFQSKMIVEAHRGRIQVESQPDLGTTFRILLPTANKS